MWKKLNNFIRFLIQEIKISKILYNNITPLQATANEILNSYSELDIENKYSEALIVVKKSIKDQSSGRIEQFLEKNRDIIKHAFKDDKLLDSYLKMLDLKNKDVALDVKEEVAKMIDRRIQDYYKLQKFKEEQELRRKIRKAKNNKELYDKLYSEWELIYNKKETNSFLKYP